MSKSSANYVIRRRSLSTDAQDSYWLILTRPLSPANLKLGLLIPLLVAFLSLPQTEALNDECHLRPVIHVLRHPGCVPKPIPSFACQGTCSSYVQVSASRFWQVERSCMCCQEMGEREATVGIFCPKSTPRFRKIITRAPVDCMCRPCTAVDESSVLPELESRLTESNEVRDISVI